jgi:capsular exopolysaccharide synthesis family protein
MIGLYAVVGIVLGLLGAFLLEYLATTIRTEQDVRRYVNLPLLGIVALIRETADRLLIRAAPKTPLGEVFNMVATMIETQAKETGGRTFMVASPNPEEGKSTVACNVSVALARGGARVLLADCDLRKAVQHKHFALPNEAGLSTYLQGGLKAIEPAILPTEVENLSLLPAGPHPESPVPLLRSERFKALLAELREKFDYVIVDVPPVRIAVDTLVLAPVVDGTVMIVSAGETRKDEASYAKRLMESARGKLTTA